MKRQALNGILCGALLCAVAPAFAASRGIEEATPPGVTLIDAEREFRDARPNFVGTAFGNNEGLKLYTSDKDTVPDQSACDAACAKDHPPFLAPARVKTFGAWSLAKRADGTAQWAYNHQPLYTSAKEAADVAAGTKPGLAEGGGWHLALFTPGDGVATPPSIAVQDIAGASGFGLVNRQGLTLYTFKGDVQKDGQSCLDAACASHWIPLAAPQLAQPIGDFTVVTRRDGTDQWAFRGKPLYTFDGDLVAGHANGRAVDKAWNVALVVSYFMPAGIGIENRTHGQTLVANGKTLYTRNRFTFQPGGFDIYDGLPQPYSKGKALGTAGCNTECLVSWRPYEAPAKAVASGHWEIATRADGTRQWMYKGYALYTFAGDKQAGDVNGNNLFDLIQRDDNGRYSMAEAGRGSGRGASALFWHIAAP